MHPAPHPFPLLVRPPASGREPPGESTNEVLLNDFFWAFGERTQPGPEMGIRVGLRLASAGCTSWLCGRLSGKAILRDRPGEQV